MDIQKEIERRFLLQEEFMGTNKPVNLIEPLVSVTVAAYQHESYIRECLDSILMQQTNFSFEIIVGEDDSKDETRAICIEYAEKYPDKIRLFLRDRNLSHLKDENGKLIKRLNGVFGFSRMSARGKYIACCEGDDYWTDPLKLQKQVEFLEANLDFSFCFHDALVIDENTGKQHLRIGNRAIDTVVDLKSVIIQNNFPTASLVYRTSVYNPASEKILKTSKGDYALVIRLAEKGLGKYIPRVMSAYRRHEGGVWSPESRIYKITQEIKFYDLLLDYFTDPKILKTIRIKRNLSYENYGLTYLRQGEIIKVLTFWSKCFFSTNNPRFKWPTHKMFGAIKHGIKSKLKLS